MSTPPVHSIESAQNPFYQQLKQTLSGKGARRQGWALVSGPRFVREVMERMPERCVAVVLGGRKMVAPVQTPDTVQVHRMPGELFGEVDTFGTKAPLLVVETPPLTPWLPADGLPPGLSLLVPFQDPDNVGAVIRSAVGFGLSSVILLREAANPFHVKAIRASAGAVFRGNLRAGPSLSDLPQDLPVVPLAPGGRALSGFEFPGTAALLPGMEGPGLPEVWNSRAVSIPLHPEVESLNAAVAAAVAMYAWAAEKS